MKVAILHLSDFHFTKNAHVYSEKIDRLVEALSTSGGFDECLVIFSGDMTSRGDKSEFTPARYTMGRIINQIRARFNTGFIPLFSVPGNHDMKLSQDSRKHADIRSYYDEGTIELHLDEEFEAMSDYFSETFFSNKDWKNKLFYRGMQSYGDFSIQINLLNTAPFSTLKPDDKECHYFPRESMHFLHKRDESRLCLTVMHHSTEWFDWSCKSDLEKTIYDNSEFLLTGHDHIGSGRVVSFGNDSGVWVSAAGSMDFTHYVHDDSFNLIVVNTDTNHFSSYMYSWDATNRVFFHKVMVEDREIDSKSHHLQPRPSFLKDIKADSRSNFANEFIEYFVFPRLRRKMQDAYKSNEFIQSYEEFYSHIATRYMVVIDGESNSGKSTLLRYLYIRLAEKAIPLYWDVEKETLSINNLIKHLFSTQYGEHPALFERYMQSMINDRYLIVDNWDVIKERDRNTILKFLQKNFGHVILGRNIIVGEGNIDIEETVKETLLAEHGETSILRIEPFFRTKRKELVRNVCLVSGSMNEENIEQVNNAINALVQNHSSMFTLNPEFIIQYTTFFSKEENHSYQRGEKLFGTIFDHNIKALIFRAINTDNIDTYLTALEEIGYFMHRNRVDHLSTEAVQNILQTYSVQYAENVKPRKFIEAMLRAKVFQYLGDGFSLAFTNRNYLAYFIARYIFRDITNNSNFEDLEDCIKYACFGINSDILLFVTYLSNNTRIVKTIGNMARELMTDWKDLSFDADGIQLISQISVGNAQAIKEPTKKDSENSDVVGEIIEEQAHDNVTICTNGIYDYDMERYDSPTYRIRRGYAYTELLAKALPAFSSILRADQKYELVCLLYAHPSKLAYAVLEPLDRHADTLTERLLVMTQQMFESGKLKEPPTAAKISSILNSLAMNFTLGIMNHFAECAVDKKTIAILNAFDTKTEAEKIQQLLMLENSGNTDQLYKVASTMLKDYKQAYMQAMIKCIMRKHLLNNTSIPYDKRQQIIDTVFGKHARKQLSLPLIEKAI